MKQLVTFLLLSFFLLSFVGCGAVDKTPSGTSEPQGTPSGGGTQIVMVENKVDLSIDKTKYEKNERIEATLDFGKLDKESSVIVIVNSDTPHGSSNVVYADEAHEEYRYISDFSEQPFYMWAPDKEGLFDVRVYSKSNNGDELASVPFAVGNAQIPKSSDKPQQTEVSLWFTDEVLSEMKLTGFTQPDGFDVLTEDELPDHMENDPYFRVIKGSPDMDGYFLTIEKVYNLLKANYGEVWTWNYYPDNYPSYKWETVMSYGGDPFYVWDGDTILSVSFTFSGSWGDVEGEVLQIRLNPNAEDPRDDYDWQ